MHSSRDLDLTESIEGMKKRQTQRHIASWDGLWALRWGNCRHWLSLLCGAEREEELSYCTQLGKEQSLLGAVFRQYIAQGRKLWWTFSAHTIRTHIWTRRRLRQGSVVLDMTAHVTNICSLRGTSLRVSLLLPTVDKYPFFSQRTFRV